MKTVDVNTISTDALNTLMARPLMEADQALQQAVAAIIAEVRAGGDAAVLACGERFDGHRAAALMAPAEWLDLAESQLDDSLIEAIDTAIETIGSFHEAGLPTTTRVQTAPGVRCEARWLPLDPVGLYVPAGSAPLPSTALMLTIPARLAGCRNIVLATPPRADGRADPAVLAIARRLGIDQVLVAGGAQAVAAMAYGTETVPKVTKIFGPGNRFVAEAKRQVAMHPEGAAMDLPAGPSEVMVIADRKARPEFVAIDLLSQAEHGPDSQVFLVTPDAELASAVNAELERLLAQLPRAETCRQALDHGAILLVRDLKQAAEIANRYAPEHLILSCRKPRRVLEDIRHAGSVFLGHWTPEALGDYLSGTNHVLPTGGWARVHAGLSVLDFMRRMTVQKASRRGLATLGPSAARLAAHEGLDAHRLALTLRLQALNEEVG
jgi:histidinol dehydrogenase